MRSPPLSSDVRGNGACRYADSRPGRRLAFAASLSSRQASLTRRGRAPPQSGNEREAPPPSGPRLAFPGLPRRLRDRVPRRHGRSRAVHPAAAEPKLVAPLRLSPGPRPDADPSLAARSAASRIIFVNPCKTVSIAFCPSGVTRAGVAFTCAVNGAGSVTLLPLGSFVRWRHAARSAALDRVAWIGVTSAAGVPATVFELE
jgi:hypothetical protein